MNIISCPRVRCHLFSDSSTSSHLLKKSKSIGTCPINMVYLANIAFVLALIFVKTISFNPSKLTNSLARATSRSVNAIMKMDTNSDEKSGLVRDGASLITGLGITLNPVMAADYAPATPPPQLPQITRQAPKAIQSGAPEKWIYSKFLDEVEKDDVEKVTFSPDGKKAVGVDTDGDRFVVDIPNDPNLLSFLVQHKVEINVAPINANNGISSADSTALQIPESDVDKLVQVYQ